MTIRLFTIKTCPSCLKYESTLGELCCRLGLSLESYDIDSDPILSVQYLREYRHCAASIPFFAVYDSDGVRVNCFSGIIPEPELELLLIKYAKE